MSNSELKPLVEAGVSAAITALGLPPVVAPIIVDLLETLANSADPASAAERLQQNALADAQDAAAEALAEQLIRAAK